MEAILSKLLVADSIVIHEGTKELKKAFENPDSTSALYQLVATSTNPEIRQYAAVLLGKRYNKSKNWINLPKHIRIEFKTVLLQALLAESVKFVKNCIARLIGVIVRHELPKNNWPEILDLVQSLVISENLSDKELGTYTLSIITEVTPDFYSKYAEPMIKHLGHILDNLHQLGSPTAYYILIIMQNLIPLVERNRVLENVYIAMMPQVVSVIEALVRTDELKAIKSFELLDELCASANGVIIPHIKPLVSLSLAIAINASLCDDLRIKAIGFIGWLSMKKEGFLKHNLLESIIDVLFTLMSAQPDKDDDDDYTDASAADDILMSSVIQTLDLFAAHLPPEKLIPYLLRHIEHGLQGINIYAKKASYMSIALLAEGCSRYIRTTPYMKSFLRYISQGIMDSSPVARNAALFALGQFSEHLQPEISQYSSELLPVLFEYLSQICLHIRQGKNQKLETKKEPPSVSRMFYALEAFCENLSGNLLPYLPTLMERLFEILETDTSVHMKQLALSAIGSAAHASKQNMLPYFAKIIKILDKYLTIEQTQDTDLQTQAIDSLGIIARTIGNENFAPLALKSLNFGIMFLKEIDDPDVRKSVYGLFAALSKVMKKEMVIFLPEIVEYMLMSIRSSEGIVAYYKDDSDSPIYGGFSEDEEEEEDIEDTDNEDESENEDIAAYGVENSYIEEKEEAVLALKEVAEHTEEAFLPYLERCFEEIFKLTNYPQEDMRIASIEALSQFCINFSKINSNEGRQKLLKALSCLVPKLSELIRLNEDMSISTSGLRVLADLLKKIKSDVLVTQGHKEAIMNCITDVLTVKTKCQDGDNMEYFGSEVEQDALMLDFAGELLSTFGKTISPEDFFIFFQATFPLLLRRLENDKMEMPRCFASGTISECLPGLNYTVAALVPELVPLFLHLTHDSSAEVRNNAIFGIGELVFYGKEAVYPYYPDILVVLSNVLADEVFLNVLDNVLGALARMIIVNHLDLPLDQIFPVFVAHLPLKEDIQENISVFKSILKLYHMGHTVLQPHIRLLLKVGIRTLYEERTGSDEAKKLIIEFIKSVQRDFPNEWNSIYTELSPEILTNIQGHLLRIFL